MQISLGIQFQYENYSGQEPPTYTWYMGMRQYRFRFRGSMQQPQVLNLFINGSL